jgi:hypothetical protein
MARDPKIRLSERHGVNPSIGVCFYCNKPDGTVVLPGRLPGDEEAPRQAVWTMTPCDDCAKLQEEGVILISARLGAGDDPRNPYRTGGWCVVREEAVRRMFDEQSAARAAACRFAFVDDEAWDALGLPRGEEIDNRGG